jgi:thiamine biosynthesis lipoprotein
LSHSTFCADTVVIITESEALAVVKQMKLNRRTVLLSSLALAACRGGPETLTLAGSTMGTSYSVVVVDGSGALDKRDVEMAIAEALQSVNSQMSNWDATSEISRFNAAQSTDAMTVSPELAALVRNAHDVHRASEGQFDLTLGPLIELWGFGAKGTFGHAPNADDIASALASSGQARKLHVNGNTLQKTDPNTQIYVSGIGKGHGVDRVAAALSALGLKDFLVEIGGDLYASGRNADGLNWQIGVESPQPGAQALQRVVAVSGMGMATSGDYRNYFENDGVRYSHILDAETGRPVTHTTTSATVLADDAMLADAWATAMLGLGSERGAKIADAQGLAVLFVDRDPAHGFKETQSAAFTALLG